MIEKVERRLALWKAKTLSRASRLTLIKAVLNNLLMYYLSLFRIPKKVAMRLIQVQRNFFWSKDDKKRGLPLVSWEVIQKSKYVGKLGVGDIVIKNAGLFFKWWWRFSDGRQPLWKRIICSNHNLKQQDDFGELQGKNIGGLWGQFTSLSTINLETLETISRKVWRAVGNGNNTLFWLHTWIGDEPLKT